MKRLSFTTCAACVLFLTGRCLCFKQKGGPRYTGSCQSCKCVTVWYLTHTKKQSRKTLYHLNKDRACECQIPCLFNPNGTCLSQGKVTVHLECRKFWKPCDHMKTVAAQLEEYSEAVGQTTPKIPDGCIPLIGYEKRKSSLLQIPFDGRNFLEERQMALKTFKKKHNLKWAQNKPKQLGNQHRISVRTLALEEYKKKPVRTVALEKSYKSGLDLHNVKLLEYFALIHQIKISDENQVRRFFKKKHYPGISERTAS